MFDIKFYKNSYPIKKKITQGEISADEFQIIEKELETFRDKSPTIFNIETTNDCNMKCVFCARTIYMTRKNIWIDDQLFEKMLDKVKVYDKQNLENFWSWLEKDAKFDPNDVSENGFYFSVVSRCLILHGYGEPFLDKYLIKRLEACKKKHSNIFFMYASNDDRRKSCSSNGSWT